jgi:hypothetical protein
MIFEKKYAAETVDCGPEQRRIFTEQMSSPLRAAESASAVPPQVR